MYMCVCVCVCIAWADGARRALYMCIAGFIDLWSQGIRSGYVTSRTAKLATSYRIPPPDSLYVEIRRDG